MVERFVRDASGFGLVEFRRIRNRSSRTQQKRVSAKGSIPPAVKQALEIVSVAPPRTINAFQLNFDYVDFVPA